MGFVVFMLIFLLGLGIALWANGSAHMSNNADIGGGQVMVGGILVVLVIVMVFVPFLSSLNLSYDSLMSILIILPISVLIVCVIFLIKVRKKDFTSYKSHKHRVFLNRKYDVPIAVDMSTYPNSKILHLVIDETLEYPFKEPFNNLKVLSVYLENIRNLEYIPEDNVAILTIVEKGKLQKYCIQITEQETQEHNKKISEFKK